MIMKKFYERCHVQSYWLKEDRLDALEILQLVKAVKEAYEARHKQKLEHNKAHMEKIQKLSLRESPLGLLRVLAHLDNEEK